MAAKKNEKRQYTNGSVTMEMTRAEFEKGGYAHQAFVDIGPADDPAPTVVVDQLGGEGAKAAVKDTTKADTDDK